MAVERLLNSNPMPNSLSRLLIAFLLVLTVPIQGFAAVGAGVCMPLGHQSGSATADQHAGDADGHHGAAAAHDHQDGKGPDKKDAHCPPCVSCCAAAAIASFHRIFSPERPGSWVAITLPAPFSGVPPEMLDRPPLAL